MKQGVKSIEHGALSRVQGVEWALSSGRICENLRNLREIDKWRRDRGANSKDRVVICPGTNILN